MWKTCNIDKHTFEDIYYLIDNTLEDTLIGVTNKSKRALELPKLPQSLISAYEEGVREVEVEFEETSIQLGKGDTKVRGILKPKLIGNSYINWRLINYKEEVSELISNSRTNLFRNILNSKPVSEEEIEKAADEYMNSFKNSNLSEAFESGVNWYRNLLLTKQLK